jgi:hypothetical protein
LRAVALPTNIADVLSGNAGSFSFLLLLIILIMIGT